MPDPDEELEEEDECPYDHYYQPGDEHCECCSCAKECAELRYKAEMG